MSVQPNNFYDKVIKFRRVTVNLEMKNIASLNTLGQQFLVKQVVLHIYKT